MCLGGQLRVSGSDTKTVSPKDSHESLKEGRMGESSDTEVLAQELASIEAKLSPHGVPPDGSRSSRLPTQWPQGQEARSWWLLRLGHSRLRGEAAREAGVGFVSLPWVIAVSSKERRPASP